MIAGEKEGAYRKANPLGNKDVDDYWMTHNPRILFYDNL